MLETLQTDFIKFARARGLGKGTVYYRHALRNTLVPVITIIGLNIGNLIAFSVITETVFAWPGLGSLLMDAIRQRDYPVVQGCVLFISCAYVLVNGLTDVAYGWLDPRTRREG